MKTLTFPLLLVTSLGLTGPAVAQNDFGDILSGVARTMVEQELEKTAFAQAQSANTAEAYRNYLSRFPNGANRANAERALARLGGSVIPGQPSPPPVSGPIAGNTRPASVEAQIGLSRTQRMQLQTQLTKLGYPTGGADGLWGSNTRAAIGRWQSANNLPATGYVTTQQVRLIAQQAGPVAGTPPPGGSDTVDDRTEEQLLSLTAEERRDIQRRLTRLGYRTGGIDGVFGAGTRRALASWQRDEGLRASGYITADQLRELRRQTG
ncbi:peptidoglycan-binding protein [Pseudotabrizicola sp. 4114]|uniref:peptidoglycan-binding domain-containing protein n=1 Tax=Pseudotabrizicola sp. 4114 TaxID=2817731 RepID=UPI002856D7CA|nr:peptidoglycan hydrolase-like protein with peptidoglycan-binding domain [Pseudorhodobacter sp. 4114]